MSKSSRRAFLSSGLPLPMAAASAQANQSAPPAGAVARSGMVYRTLGKTGVKVGRLGMGGNNVSDPSVIDMAFDAGINLFDTARSYLNGNAERMIGATLKSKRKDAIIQTKTHANTKADALRDLETSLREMGTDYIDIWLLHGRNTPADISDDVLEVQRQAKQQGKIRCAGVSMHSSMKDMIPYLVKRGQTDVILTTYNFSMGPEMEMEKAIATAHQAGLGVISMKALAGGFARIQRGDALYSNDPTKLTARLKRPGAMVSALKWALRNQDLDSTIVGILDRDQIEEDLAALHSPFTETDTKLLAAQLDFIRPLYCRMCGACAGQCPQGLPVSDMLRIMSYADGYRQFAMARQHFLELPEPVRQVRCADCAACAVRCPNGVHVAQRLAKAQAWLA